MITTQRGRGTYIWETPSDEIKQRLRLETLEGLTRRYLAQASPLGFTPEEVAEVVIRQLQNWKEDGPLTEPDTN